MAIGIDGVILAGGRARRMGGQPKGLLELGARPLLCHIIERARPQVRSLALNVPSDQQDLYRTFQLPMFADPIGGFVGPLGGVLAALTAMNALRHGSSEESEPYVMTFTTDAPFIPVDLVARLEEGRRSMNAEIVCASSQQRRHPLFALWHLGLKDDLQDALEKGVRKVEDWTQRHRTVCIDFDVGAYDPFFNVNGPEDLAHAQQLLDSL